MFENTGGGSNASDETKAAASHRQEKLPAWLTLPLEMQQAVIREMTAAWSASAAPWSGAEAGMAELPGLLRRFNDELLEKRLATPYLQNMEDLAGAVLVFHEELEKAADNLSSELHDHKDRWEAVTKRSLGELVDLARSTLDILDELRDGPAPFTARRQNAAGIHQAMQDGAAIVAAAFSATLSNAGGTGVPAVDKALRQGSVVAFDAWKAMFGLDSASGKSKNGNN